MKRSNGLPHRGRRPAAGILWLAIALTIPPAVSAAGAWPQWGGPHRNFRVDSPALAERWPAGGPRRLWTRELGEGYSAIVADASTLYTMYRDGEQEVIVALRAENGETRWEHRYLATTYPDHAVKYGKGPNATPLVAGDRLIAIGYTGILHALDAESGEQMWSHDLIRDFQGEILRFGYSASPLRYRDTIVVLVGGKTHGVVAFDPRDGSVVWKSPPLYTSYASPIAIRVAGQDQIVFLSSEQIIGIDAENGDYLWSAPCRNGMGNNASDPVWGDGNLLWVASQPGDGTRVLRLAQRDGKTRVSPLWSTSQITIHYWNAIRVGDYVYASIGGPGTILAAIDVRTGEIAWRERGFRRAHAIYADDKLIFLDEDGRLVLARVSPETIDVLAQAPLFEDEAWTVPTLVGSTLYARNRKTIVAVELGEARGETPPPSRQAN